MKRNALRTKRHKRSDGLQEEKRKIQETRDQLWATLESCRDSGETIIAEVLGTNSDGLLVKWEGWLGGFVPFSDCRDIANRDNAEALAKLSGQSFEFNVLETDRPKFKLTRTAIIMQAFWDTIVEGQVLDGVVVGVTRFGAFVRVAESIDGLVHISELSREWVNQVTDVVSIGQSVKVQVLGVEVGKNRLSLSIKDAFPDSWDDIEAFLPIGEERTGKVQRIEDNKRVVVDIGDGLEGRIHVSELGDWKIEDFHLGTEVKASVLRIDQENQRIWLRLIDYLSA